MREGFTLIELLGALLLLGVWLLATGFDGMWAAIGLGVFFGGNVGSFGWDVRDRRQNKRGGIAVPALCGLVALLAGWFLIPADHRTAGLITMGLCAGFNFAILNFMRDYEAAQKR